MNSQFKQMKQELKQVLKRELKHYFDGYSSDSSHSEIIESDVDSSDSDSGLFTGYNPYRWSYTTSLETVLDVSLDHIRQLSNADIKVLGGNSTIVVKSQNVEALKLAREQTEIILMELGKKQETSLILKQKDLQISNLQEEVASLKYALDEKKEEIKQWFNRFEEPEQKDLQISNLQEEVASLRKDLVGHDEYIVNNWFKYIQEIGLKLKDLENSSLQNALHESRKELFYYREETDLKLKKKDHQISNLQEKVTSLENAGKMTKEENWIDEIRNDLVQNELHISNFQEKRTSSEHAGKRTQDDDLYEMMHIFMQNEFRIQISNFQEKTTSHEYFPGNVTIEDNSIDEIMSHLKKLQISTWTSTYAARGIYDWPLWYLPEEIRRKRILAEKATLRRIILTLCDSRHQLRKKHQAVMRHVQMYKLEAALHGCVAIKCETCWYPLWAKEAKELGISGNSLRVKKFAKPLHCKSCWKKFIRNRDRQVRKDTGGKLFKCKPFKKAFWRR